MFNDLRQAKSEAEISTKDYAQVLDIENEQVHEYNNYQKEWKVRDLQDVINS